MDKSNGIEKTKQLSTDLKDAGHIQNIVLIWLDSTANDSTIDCDNTIKQFKRIVNTIKTFTNDEQCIQFMQSMTDSRICLITSDAFGQRILPYIHGMTQLDTILIFSHNKQLYEEWTKKYPKFKGVFTEISSICEALQIAVHQCEQNILPISLFNVNIANESDEIFNRLDLSFVFIQVIKEILSKIDFGEIHLDEYVNYCRDLYPEDDDELENISQLSRDYYSKRPIWWYTQESFMCRMLHRAIRSLDAGIIVRMGFFIDDLHRDIQRFYSEQFDNPDSDTKTLTVYRGQGLLVENFDRLSKLKNGFISFNDFLLTNKNRQIAYDFAQQTATNPDLVGILFIMNIDTTDSMTPFADITKVGFFKTQDEVLFSMQSIFRIDDIELIDTNNHIYEVTLTLMKNDEENLRKLTNRIREETFFDKVGWARFGQLLIKMNQFQKAQEVYEVSLNQTTYDSEKPPLYYQLGWLKHQQKDYQAALTFYEQSLYIAHETLPSNHISLASSHTSIGAVHYSMGNYPKALASYDKALEIRQKSLPANHLDLASAYQDLGMTYNSMNDYAEALSHYEQALQIRKQTLPSNHPDLIATYNNIGMVHYNMGNYAKALSSYENAFKIQQQSHPTNHPNMAIYYNNTGMVYNNMGDYSNALASYEKALHIQQQILSSNHPDLAISYNNVGMVNYTMGDYAKALSSYEKALEIQQQNLPAHHPDLGESYHNIGMAHFIMGNYTDAISSYEKSLEIKQQSLSQNNPSLGTTYNNIGMVYINMRNYSKALSYLENALQIRQQSLHPNHPDLAMSFGYIGNVYNSMGERKKALPFCQRAIDIAQQTLPSNHPHVQWYRNILQDIEKNL